MQLQSLKDRLANDLFGMTKAEAVEQGICIDCKEPALPNCYSDAGVREYYISGMCEECFDNMFKEDNLPINKED